MIRMRGIMDNEAGLRVRWMFKRIKRRLGHVPFSARIRACFNLLRLSEKMSAHVAESVAVTPKLKELAQLKVAAMVGCPL